MSTGEKKTTPAPSPTSSGTASTSAPSTQPSPSSAKPGVTRRRFLMTAAAASTVLAGASLAGMGVSSPGIGGILQPLIPTPRGPQPIANAATLEDQYDSLRGTGSVAYQFFYWPYDITVSPYYRNIVVRLPDELLDPSLRGSKTPNLAHFVAWNTTCVHLRCLVNPAQPAQTDGEYRLLCPCHGSQYRLISGVPAKGPAFDLGLGLNGLPRIILSLDSSNNLVAEKFDGDPGIGRTD